MPEPSPFVERAVALLTPLGPVRAKSMFGGWGIFLDGVMLALIAQDALFFRVDEETKDSFEAAGSQPFVYEARGKRMEMAYWLAPDGSLEDSESLLPWAELGLAAAKRVKAKRPKKKGKKKG